MRSDAGTVDEYLAALPDDRRAALVEVRDTIRAHLPDRYEEVMNWGMVTYQVPLELYPDTYNKQPLAYISLASQKNYVSLYLMGVYADRDTEQWFVEGFKSSGKKLNMGKSCVRFKTLDDLPLDLIGEAVSRTTPDQFIELYEAARAPRKN